ncbi:DUF6049 family protein [Jiangella mangrovi]|uniref:Glycoprotein n=1 Tax=Jiangella mangrovi TaxID=1524084 RepID=A0A7W9LKI1_9ACTN|nr:DUF6049 family protein [Jiangella mangrovi]MBB5787168.1 hypothetical protein [Jiangella mangrovi]
MRLPGLRPLAAITAPVAVAAAALLAPGAAVAAPARVTAEAKPAPSEGMAAENAFTGVSPSVLTPADDTLTLSGTIRNTGEVPLVDVQVLPRFSRVPLEQRTDVRQVAADPEVRPGRRYVEAFAEVTDVLEPGETRTYDLDIPAELLAFDQAGVYAVGVDVRVDGPDGGPRVTVATTRTVVPYVSPEDLPSVPVGVLWPLAAPRPTLTPDGTLTDDTLAEELASGGPLSDLLVGAADAPVTWAVDPDLLRTAGQMSDGYQVASSSGPVDGPQAGVDAAGDWLELFDLTTRDHDVWMLPYALPDFAAFEQHDPALAAELAQESLAAADTAGQGLSQATTGVAWLDGGSVTENVLTTLAEAGARTVVVPGDAVEPGDAGALGDLSAGEDGLRTVAAGTGLSSAVADAAADDDPAAGAADLRQRWVAETAMVALAAARDDTAPPLMVAAPPVRWRPDERVLQSVLDTWTSTPWVEPVGLSGAVEAEAAPEVSPSPTEGTTMLPEASVAATAQLRDDATQYSTLLADPEDVTPALTLATLRSASTGWRSDPETSVSYARGIARELAGRLQQVSVNVPESVTLSSRAGSFPLTLTNELDDPVNVRVEVQSDNPDRLRITEVPRQEMAAGEQVLVEITAEAAANGRVPIEVQLTTDDGRPIGPAVPTVVNATEYGTIGWLIVGAAGALFAAAIARRMLRSRRQQPRGRRRGVAPDEPPGLPAEAALPDLPAEARPTQEAAR